MHCDTVYTLSLPPLAMSTIWQLQRIQYSTVKSMPVWIQNVEGYVIKNL